MTDDQQLLRAYVEDHSEPAFAGLVTRHIDLVYSAALRFVNGDAHLARDVAQTVFIDLARKAPALPRDAVLAGWLHRHTCFTAATAIRAERRRKTREQTAAEMKALDDHSEPQWAAIAPQLDGALNHLSAPDRDAIALRFLQRMDLREVGAALGISEDAAQKRVSRALEKLRAILGLRGVHLTAIALASLLATQAVSAAPIGLAGGISAAALSAAKTPATTLTILKFMASTKAKLGILSALVLAGATAPLVIQHQAQAALRAQEDTMRTRAGEIAQWQNENTWLSNSVSTAQASQPATTGQPNETLRLRGEIGRLQAAIREMSGAKTNAPLSRDDVLASMRQLFADRATRLKEMIQADPSQTVPELKYLTDQDLMPLVQYDHHRIDPDKSRALSSVRGQAQSRFANGPLAKALRKYAKSNRGQFPADVSQLAPYFDSPVDDSVLQNWVVLAGNQLPESLRVDDPWVITQKAPVNAALDQRYIVGLKTMEMGHGSNQWDTAP